MDISNHASRYKEWENKYNWDTCKANRRHFGEFLAHFLTTDSRVINLDGIYGSGKTEFIRRLYVELAKKNYPVVYIDIWESDFSSNPLTVICSELLQQVECALQTRAPSGKGVDKRKALNKLNTLKEKLSTYLQCSSIAATFYSEPSTAADLATLNSLIKAVPDFDTSTASQKYVEEVKKNHLEAVQAIKDIKKHITFISALLESIYSLNIPIVILIDELDRCRPTYAIEVLEVIKHFFEADGCTFLVATHTNVLESSVKAVYGSEFDANQYLRRFFDRKVNLPQISTLDYLKTRGLHFKKYTESNINLLPFNDNLKENIPLFAALFESFNIELRGIEQILNRFFASLDYSLNIQKKPVTTINTVVLIMGLIEQHLEITSLSMRSNFSKDHHNITKVDSDYVDYSLPKMVSLMFSCVTLTESRQEHVKGGEHYNYSVAKQMLNIKSINFSEVKLNDRASNDRRLFEAIIRQYEDSNCHYWMWEDHKKIIELSGHIE